MCGVCVCVHALTCMLNHFSHVKLFVPLWTVALQTLLLSMGFSRQEYWSGLPCPPPGDLPNPGTEPTFPMAPALQADSLALSHHRSVCVCVCVCIHIHIYIYFFRFFYLTGHCCCCCSVCQSHLTLCNTMDCSTPGFPVLHHVPMFAQTHVH